MIPQCNNFSPLQIKGSQTCVELNYTSILNPQKKWKNSCYLQILELQNIFKMLVLFLIGLDMA